jgi:hypothetical protein
VLKQEPVTQATIDTASPITQTPTKPHTEIQYQGTCYGQKCFKINKSANGEEEPIGYCTRRGVYIMVDLAKRQMLCDDEETRYSPEHPANKQAEQKKKKVKQ